MDRHERFMTRALELAELGRGSVSPNPMVGCVITYQDQIIGEGYHESYGGPHAEPNAIHAVEDPHLLKEASVYVTLEPCAHFGKTPPCADLLVSKGVKEVIIAARDSNPLVGGQGIARLEAAGITVLTGVLEREARLQNRRFFTMIEKQRPYIILKWAQTMDGFIARSNYDSKWISNELSRQLVHRWRAEEDAILVGTKTAHYDNPRLNVRDWTGKDPLRLVIDNQLTLDTSLHLFDQTQPTVCYNLVKSEQKENLQYVRLERGYPLTRILGDLNQRKTQSLIVEGGSVLLQHFIGLGLWDEARVFTGTSTFGEGIPSPKMGRPACEIFDIEGDRLERYINA